MRRSIKRARRRAAYLKRKFKGSLRAMLESDSEWFTDKAVGEPIVTLPGRTIPGFNYRVITRKEN